MEQQKVVVFQSREEEYAISVEHVISIEKLERINPIPQLPPYFLGLMKIRGELVPILDLEWILYKQHGARDELSKVLVIQTSEMFIGLLVKEAKEIMDLSEDVLQPLGLVRAHNITYFSAVANLENRVITMIDPEQFVHSIEGMKDIKNYVESNLSDDVE